MRGLALASENHQIGLLKCLNTNTPYNYVYMYIRLYNKEIASPKSLPPSQISHTCIPCGGATVTDSGTGCGKDSVKTVQMK